MLLKILPFVSWIQDHSGHVGYRSIDQIVVLIELHPGVADSDSKELVCERFGRRWRDCISSFRRS